MKTKLTALLLIFLPVLFTACPDPNNPNGQTSAPQIQVKQGTVVIAAETTGYEFDRRQVNTTSGTVQFEIEKRGTENLIISSDLTLTDTVNFTLEQPSALEIEPEGGTTFTLSYHPLTKGTKTASVTVKSNDPDYPVFFFDISADAVGDGSLTFRDQAGPDYTITAADDIANLAVSPDNKFLYCQHFDGSGDNSILYYSIDSASGELSNPHTFSHANINDVGPFIISADGAFVYGINYENPETLFRLSRDASTGALTYVGSTTDDHYDPASLALSHDQLSLFVVHNTTAESSGIDWYTRDSATGALTLKQPDVRPADTNLGIEKILISPDDAFIYCFVRDTVLDQRGLCWFFIVDGELLYEDKLLNPVLYSYNLMAMSPDGRDIYVTADSTDPAERGLLWLRRNTATGTLTYKNRYTDDSMKPYSTDMAVSEDGFNLYLTTLGIDATGNVVWYSRDYDGGSLSGINSAALSASAYITSSLLLAEELDTVYVSGKNTSTQGVIRLLDRNF